MGYVSLQSKTLERRRQVISILTSNSLIEMVKGCYNRKETRYRYETLVRKARARQAWPPFKNLKKVQSRIPCDYAFELRIEVSWFPVIISCFVTRLSWHFTQFELQTYHEISNLVWSVVGPLLTDRQWRYTLSPVMTKILLVQKLAMNTFVLCFLMAVGHLDPLVQECS